MNIPRIAGCTVCYDCFPCRRPRAVCWLRVFIPLRLAFDYCLRLAVSQYPAFRLQWLSPSFVVRAATCLHLQSAPGHACAASIAAAACSSGLSVAGVQVRRMRGLVAWLRVREHCGVAAQVNFYCVTHWAFAALVERAWQGESGPTAPLGAVRGRGLARLTALFLMRSGLSCKWAVCRRVRALRAGGAAEVPRLNGRAVVLCGPPACFGSCPSGPGALVREGQCAVQATVVACVNFFGQPGVVWERGSVVGFSSDVVRSVKDQFCTERLCFWKAK